MRCESGMYKPLTIGTVRAQLIAVTDQWSSHQTPGDDGPTLMIYNPKAFDCISR